jgi:hypothetical protein
MSNRCQEEALTHVESLPRTGNEWVWVKFFCRLGVSQSQSKGHQIGCESMNVGQPPGDA